MDYFCFFALAFFILETVVCPCFPFTGMPILRSVFTFTLPWIFFVIVRFILLFVEIRWVFVCQNQSSHYLSVPLCVLCDFIGDVEDACAKGLGGWMNPKAPDIEGRPAAHEA